MQERANVREFFDPIPEPNGKLYDEFGNTVREIPHRRAGIVARVDDKVGERITVTKGTLFLIGILPAFLMVVLQYGGSLISWARQDQTNIERSVQIQNDLKRLADSQDRIEQKWEKLDERLREQERMNDKTQGYKLGATDAATDKHNR
jgi:septal ring factor EnvC (AmiA/AmiB activator)